jgi:hypothetical protein
MEQFAEKIEENSSTTTAQILKSLKYLSDVA